MMPNAIHQQMQKTSGFFTQIHPQKDERLSRFFHKADFAQGFVGGVSKVKQHIFSDFQCISTSKFIF